MIAFCRATPARRAAVVRLMLAALAAVSGCQRHPRDSRPQAPEPDFAAQAARVRSGAADEMRLDTRWIGDDDLVALDGLEDRLRRLNLSHTGISDAGLARIARLRALEQLRLSSRRLTDAGLACLNDLEHLRHLHLLDAPIGDAGLAHLEGLRQLHSLYLDGAQASDQARRRLVEALPGVHLHFDGGHHPGDAHADAHGPAPDP